MYTNSCESEKTHSMRIWRNWQTRTVQVRVNIVFVEVRILLSAPKDDLRVICSQVFVYKKLRTMPVILNQSPLNFERHLRACNFQ